MEFLVHLIRVPARLTDHQQNELAANCRPAEGFCGTTQCYPRWVPVADETFVCRRCHARAERYGVPTFGLIPDSGCAVSGGKRGLRGRPWRAA